MDEGITVELDRLTLDALQDRAKAHGRSISEEVGTIVRDQVRKVSIEEDPVAWARRIQAMTPSGVKQTPAVQLIREDRDR